MLSLPKRKSRYPPCIAPRNAVSFENSRLFRTPFIRSHPPRLRDHPGVICLVYGRLLRCKIRVSRVSIHPAREKRRFVFLRASLNLIIDKQACFSSPFHFSISAIRPESVPASCFSSSIQDGHSFAFGSIEIKLGEPIRLDITKYPVTKPFAPLINAQRNLFPIYVNDLINY